MSRFFRLIVLIIFIFILFISIFFIPFFYNSNTITPEQGQVIDFTPTDGFIWPIPGYTRISSYFGKRNRPTSGASTYHKGIDIPAPPGTNLIAVTNGKITFTKFLGGGGYTITLSTGNMKISYCHVNPNYIVKVGDIIEQGQIIGQVGPKNVYGVKGNPYKDSQGRPTNGATTGPHLHFGIRVNNKYANPLDYY